MAFLKATPYIGIPENIIADGNSGLRLEHRSLNVDNLWGKINTGNLIEDTEKSQLLKSLEVNIGSKIFYSAINYYN